MRLKRHLLKRRSLKRQLGEARRTAGFAVSSALLAAASAYFLDPQSGRGRRIQLRDRAASSVRRGWRKTTRKSRVTVQQASGTAQGALHRERPKDLDDVTLARKVETEIFRDPDVPKGAISVNAEHGTVYLRGEVTSPELIEKLEVATKRVPEVERVENLLHSHSPGVSSEGETARSAPQ